MREIRLNGRELAGLSDAVLTGGGSLRFQARGFSMHPLIRDGDTIVVRPCNAGDLRVGTVVFYRTASGRPVAHRIVGSRTSPGNRSSPLWPKNRENHVGAPLAAPVTYFDRINGIPPDLAAVEPDSRGLNGCDATLVRGDASNSSVELVDPQQVLGVVAAVERGDRVLRLDRSAWKAVGFLAARFPWLGPWLSTPAELGRKIAAAGLHAIQRFDLYRLLAAKTIGKAVSCRAATVADAAEFASFYRYDRYSEIADPTVKMARDMAGLDPNGTFVCAVIRGRIVGAAVIRRFPGEGVRHPDWWLFGLGVRTIVRGAGIGERLLELAIDAAQSRGASRVYLLVDATNRVARSLYAKTGFVQATIPALQQSLDEEAGRSNTRQIVLVKQLTQNAA